MKSTIITCDSCGRDITTTTNYADFRLALTVEGISRRGNTATLMQAIPPLTRDHHFCGLSCLEAWVNKEGPK